MLYIITPYSITNLEQLVTRRTTFWLLRQRKFDKVVKILRPANHSENVRSLTLYRLPNEQLTTES